MSLNVKREIFLNYEFLEIGGKSSTGGFLERNRYLWMVMGARALSFPRKPIDNGAERHNNTIIYNGNDFLRFAFKVVMTMEDQVVLVLLIRLVG